MEESDQDFIDPLNCEKSFNVFQRRAEIKKSLERLRETAIRKISACAYPLASELPGWLACLIFCLRHQ